MVYLDMVVENLRISYSNLTEEEKQTAERIEEQILNSHKRMLNTNNFRTKYQEYEELKKYMDMIDDSLAVHSPLFSHDYDTCIFSLIEFYYKICIEGKF